MLHIRVTHINVDKNRRFGDDSVHETMYESSGKLYKELVKLYGRCTSKVYIDVKQPDGSVKAKQIGWVFEKRSKYDDCNETFLQETWVDVLEEKPTITVHQNYHNFS